MDMASLLAHIFEKAPQLGDALYAARGPCLRYQGTHPSQRRCKKGKNCPYLHVRQGEEWRLATNRLRAPFIQLTRDNKILVVPPLMQAVKYWWRHTLQQETACPITGVDVLR